MANHNLGCLTAKSATRSVSACRILWSPPPIMSKCTLIDRPLSRCAGLPMHGFRTQKVCGSGGRVNATFWRAKRILADIIFFRTTEVIRAYV